MSKDESVTVEVDQTVGASNSTTTQTSGGINMTEGQPLTAQEISQMIAQANDALMSKLSAMLSSGTSTNVSEERTYDIGEGEAWKFNMKRTADEYQHESLESIRRSRLAFDQITQNAITASDMVTKQAIRHADLAIDRQWNVDEQAGFVAKILNSIQDPAMATAMAVAIAQAMLDKE